MNYRECFENSADALTKAETFASNEAVLAMTWTEISKRWQYLGETLAGVQWKTSSRNLMT